MLQDVDKTSDVEDLPQYDDTGAPEVIEKSKHLAAQLAPAVPNGGNAASEVPIKLISESDNDDDDEDSDDEMEADNEKEEDYEGLETHVFKTANRLIDDICTDLIFLLSHNIEEDFSRGILRLAPLAYAKKISQLKYNPYELFFPEAITIDTSDLITRRPSYSNPKDKVTIIRAILFSNEEPSLTKSKVFHVRIAIKTKAASEKPVSKNEFHLCDELSYEDSVDLIPSFNIRENDPESVRNAVPTPIDSASYVCALTKKVMRIDIMAPEFDEDDLGDFEMNKITVRWHKARQINPELPEEPPTPVQCLFTLFKVVRGPLLAPPGSALKTINASNQTLISRINPSILFRKMSFEQNDSEYVPPQVSDSTNRLHVIMREKFLRQIIEIAFLGTKAYSGHVADKPFSDFVFSNKKHAFFRELSDNASLTSHTFENSESFVALSVYPFYSDDLVIKCYKKMLKFDPANVPLYFDALQAISNSRHNFKLTRFVKEQIEQGTVGMNDVNSAFSTLGIEPSQAPYIDEDLLLTMYQNECAQHPHDGRFRAALKIVADYKKSGKLARYLKYETIALSQAYEMLGIDQTVDDDVVATAVMVKKVDSPELERQLTRAFITIAADRKSFPLLNQIEHEYPDYEEDCDYKQACEYLGVDENATDIQAIEIFQAGNRDIKKARMALRRIGLVKKSKLIEKFLASGMIDHTVLPADHWPVGLINTGNTCYLNSLLQYYFAIKPLREYILSFNDVYTGQDIYKDRRIGGRLIQEEEIERSFQFTYQLRNLFYEQIHSSNRTVEPVKALQFLAFLPTTTPVKFGVDEPKKSEETNTEVEEIKIDFEDDDKENQVPAEEDLIELDPPSSGDVEMADTALSQTTNPLAKSEDVPEVSAQPKAALISEAEMETAFEMGRQQDVTECIGNVMMQLEISCKPDGFDEEDQEQLDFLKTIFFGRTIQNLTKVDDPSVHRDQVARFSSLFVNLSDKPRNWYDALDSLFLHDETVESGGDKFERNEKIVEMPPVLQFQIQRVYYDTKKFEVYKDTSALPFPDTLYMDRYFRTEDPEIIAKRAQVNEWKEKHRQLKEYQQLLLTKNQQDLSYKDAMKTTKDWIQAEGLADDETVQVLEGQIAQIDKDLNELFKEIMELENKIDHHFDGSTKIAYKVFAVFIHRGHANYGHYWIYIRDFKRNIFRKYNDELVTEVPATEVFTFEDKGSQSATPYFVAYIRAGREDDVDPLCRIVEEQ